jgi:hypothetical protein
MRHRFILTFLMVFLLNTKREKKCCDDCCV